MFSWRPMSMPQMLSILTPMYNEAGGLDAFFQSLEAALAPLDVDYEIICVDDGSTDNTLARLRHHVERNPRIKVVVLSRDRKSTRLNSSHVAISYAVFCLKQK